MRPNFLLTLCVGVLFFTGCASVTSRVKERFTGVPPRVRVFPAEQRAVYNAARVALKDLGYTFERGGPAQGIIEAYGPITSTDDSLSSSRQLTVSIRLQPAAQGGTEADVWLKEVYQDKSITLNSQATETPVPDDAFYSSFFNEVQQALAHPPKS